jgi:twitching motility protein PilT
MTETDKKILGILQLALQHKVSDVHLAAGSAPAFRTHDGINPLNLPAFTEEEMMAACQLFVAKPEIKATLADITDLDGSFEYPGLGRFRYNIFRHKNHLGAVLRVIASKVPSIAELKLPNVLKKISEASRGLVLVTGATGSGKSSTLAAMIDHINATQSCHILTVEDPIEFVHTAKRSRLTQREVGRDTANFASALRSALRQDPDVILVGEMRDIETLDIALKAAETGHLVFSTVHTTDAIKTIGRLVSMFPAEEQQAVRLRLADNIHATVSQRLINAKEGKSKVVAQEIMISNLAIRDCIASDKKTGEMNTFIEKGHEVLGSQTFDQHLSFLVQRGEITVDVALEAATNPADFQRNLAFGEHGNAIEDNNAANNIQMESVVPTPVPDPKDKTAVTGATSPSMPTTPTATTTVAGPPKLPKPKAA